MQGLVSSGAATWKRHVTIQRIDDKRKELIPGAWLARKPWNVELRTLHLDRARIDADLRRIAEQLGVATLIERVAEFAVLDEEDRHKRRILGLRTGQGTYVRASWFIDASGSDASLLGRRFDLKATVFGPRKAAIWAHVPTERWVEGTMLYMLPSAGEYMEWIWEIPIRPGLSSVGYIASGAAVKAQRIAGSGVQEILMRRCRKFRRLEEITGGRSLETHTTTFLCRTYEGVCGSNWVIIGEAASQSDPITGNGVTAALRHAEEAARLMLRSRSRGTIPRAQRSLYDLRARTLGLYFNSLIEDLFYRPNLRDRLGMFTTGRIYTVPAWLMNLVYARMRPADSPTRTVTITSLLNAVRWMARLAYQAESLVGAHSGSPRHPSTGAGREQNYAV